MAAGSSSLACYTCRNRKVKCDKTLPGCVVCVRNGQPCRYPAVQHKPGPKLGSHSSRHRKHRPSKSQNGVGARFDDATDCDMDDFSQEHEQSRKSPSPSLQDSDTTGSPTSSSGSVAAQSWVFHNFHENQSYTISSIIVPTSRALKNSPISRAPLQNNMASICYMLGLSRQMLSTLVRSYFENMTFLSLFHRPMFDRMVYSSVEPGVASALVAAMCAFAAHYIEQTQIREPARLDPDRLDPDMKDASHSPLRFYKVARDMIHRQLDKCGDSKPPLALLQAYILVTFYEMMTSARGRAWRSLGACIRISHELELHLTDAALQGKSGAEQKTLALADSWCEREEQRRAWWVLYELDIFISTVRRRPTGIHAGEHAVLLPVCDADWYEGHYQASGFLDPDPLHRTRKLLESGNISGKAWYLVLNSLVHDAHVTANPTAHRDRKISTQDVGLSCSEPVDERKLAVLDDFMLYFKTVLPKHLAYEGDYLSFSTSDAFGEPSAAQDYDRQLIHAMMYLGKLMVLHHACCKSNTQRVSAGQTLTEYFELNQTSVGEKLRAILGFVNDLTVWNKYLGAAEEVIRVIRNASPNHIRYGHPLLASTFWIAAATQLFKKAFAKDEAEEELAQSNFDLLRLTLDRSHKFWNTSDLMVRNIDTLEARLAELKARLINAQPTVQHGSTVATDSQRREVVKNSPDASPHNQASDFGGVGYQHSNEDFAFQYPQPDFDDSAVGDFQMFLGGANPGQKQDEGELPAFMYDFCADSWDLWNQELIALFPPLSGQL